MTRSAAVTNRSTAVTNSSTDTLQNLDHRQNLSLLKVYTMYRLVVCVILIVTLFTNPSDTLLFGKANLKMFLYGVISYFLINLVTLVLIVPKTRQLTDQQLFLNFFIDVVAILVMIDASGGVASGLELLLVVTIAACSIMLPSQIALLLTAIASLGLLAETASQVYQQAVTVSGFISTGLVGMVLFLTAFFIRNLASRIRGSQLLAYQHALDVGKLQQLNQQIVHRMRTGIIVCRQNGEILLANSAAGELLGETDIANRDSMATRQLPALLKSPLSQWLSMPTFRPGPLHIQQSDREVLVSFTAISEGQEADTLIFLEDNRRLVKQAQQMKLASLGRLTASIAHEIRNPLGAVSHAAQLLAESEKLSSSDQRLCDIIENHCDRMNRVIENILNLSSRNAPDPERIALATWLQRFIDEFDAYASDVYDNWAIEFRCDNTENDTFIDSSQMLQVLINLSVNGLRYSLQHCGEAKIVFHLFRHPVTQLPVLDVIDFGPGVDPEAIQHIFEPFYTTDPRGSGLGLYISRELCEANEARLDYIRTESGQSCFRISFPHPDRQPAPE